MGLKGITAVIDKFKINEGYIISKEKIANKTIKIIPAFKFLTSKNLRNIKGG